MVKNLGAYHDQWSVVRIDKSHILNIISTRSVVHYCWPCWPHFHETLREYSNMAAAAKLLRSVEFEVFGKVQGKTFIFKDVIMNDLNYSYKKFDKKI